MEQQQAQHAQAPRSFTALIGSDAHGPFRDSRPGASYRETRGGKLWLVTISQDVKRPRCYPAASDVWEATITVQQVAA